MKKKNLAFVIEDYNDNVFGGFIENEIDSMYYKDNNNNMIGHRISDNHAMLFTIMSNKRYACPLSFLINPDEQENAFKLPRNTDNDLFRFGINDLRVFKRELKHTSAISVTQFQPILTNQNQYIQPHFFINSNPKEIRFNPKRIQVWQMALTKQQIQSRQQRKQQEEQIRLQKFNQETNTLRQYSQQVFANYKNHLTNI